CYIVSAMRFVATFLLLTSVAWGQFNTGEITGSVKDISGAIIPGAVVIAVHTATGFQLQQTADTNGQFLLANLPTGQYTVSVDLAGFKRTNRNLTLAIGQKVRLDFALEPGSVAEEVTVVETDPASLLQTQNAEVSDIIENSRIVNLPLNGRQFLDLALL